MLAAAARMGDVDRDMVAHARVSAGQRRLAAAVKKFLSEDE